MTDITLDIEPERGDDITFDVGAAGAGSGVELGETSTTAYRGDRGAQAYAHLSDATDAHAISAITGLVDGLTSLAGAAGAAQSAADDAQDAADAAQADADGIAAGTTPILYTGTGLYAGLGSVSAAVTQSEGYLDRPTWITGAQITGDVDVSAPFPTLQYGEVVYDAVNEIGGVVILLDQDPFDTSIYYQSDEDGYLTPMGTTARFYPPGNGDIVTLNDSGSTVDGMFWRAVDDAKGKFHPAGGPPGNTANPSGDYRLHPFLPATALGGSIADPYGARAYADSVASGGGGWAYRATIPFGLLKPLTFTAWTPTYSNNAGGGHATGTNANTESWTYEFPLAAGTYTARLVARYSTASPIITLALSTVGSLGTVDCYNGSTTLNNETVLSTSVDVPADGYYTLTITNPTRNGSASGWAMTPQVFEMYRTGA